MSDMTKTLWGQFMTAFQDQIKIEGVPQMLTGPTPWNWGGKNPPMGSLPYQQVQFLNIVPASPQVDPNTCLLYTSPSPRDRQKSRMPSSA